MAHADNTAASNSVKSLQTKVQQLQAALTAANKTITAQQTTIGTQNTQIQGLLATVEAGGVVNDLIVALDNAVPSQS